jgi:succinate-semialdehyde dehydrogenase/glutarate-semialdehyde dehydrogenase
MGKPIKQSQGETDKTINFCKYYSKNYSDLLPTQVKSDAKVKTLIKYLPMGVVYNIIPFNFPFFLAFKGALPNLLLGNAILARNSDSTPLLGDKI